MKVSAPLMPFANADFPVDVSFRFSLQDAKYSLDIQANGFETYFHLPLQAGDVKGINVHLRNSVLALAKVYGRGNPSATIAKNSLRDLATDGYWAFKKLFSSDELRSVLDKVLADARCIQIVSDDCFLPWELLYSKQPRTVVDISSFWGIKHIIHRVIPDPDRRNFPPSVIPVRSRPRVGLFADRMLPDVVNDEVPYFNELHDDKKIILLTLRDLRSDSDARLEELQEIAEFFEQKFHIAHLACHAEHDLSEPSDSFIRLSNSFRLSIKDLETLDVVLRDHPFVMLNACETAASDPFSTSQFARVFLRLGARGVLATEAELPDGFGALFAKQLYRYLLNGKPLGESLYLARWDFLNSDLNPQRITNPSALLYSMYAPPSIRLGIT